MNEKIKNLRLQKRLSQESLGELVGVSGQAVSKWERGNAYPDIELLDGLFTVLDCSPDYLFQYEKANRFRLL